MAAAWGWAVVVKGDGGCMGMRVCKRTQDTSDLMSVLLSRLSSSTHAACPPWRRR